MVRFVLWNTIAALMKKWEKSNWKCFILLFNISIFITVFVLSDI